MSKEMISRDNYVDSQPAWISSLPQNVHFFTENGKIDMELIWKDLQKLWVVTNGVRWISTSSI